MVKYFEKVKLSLLEKDFGERIKAEDFGKSMWFLLILMLFIGSIIMIKAEIEIYKGMNEVVTKLEIDFPDFELKNGHFVCQGKMPFIRNGENKSVFIIDTSGKHSGEILDVYKSGIFISESKIINKKNAVETTSYNLSDFKSFSITKDKIIEILSGWKIPGLVILFILSLFFIYVWKLIGVVTLSLIALIISKVLKTEIDYQNLFKIGIYAIFLPTIINSALGIAEVKIPYFWIVYYAIATFYVVRYVMGFKSTDNVATEIITTDKPE